MNFLRTALVILVLAGTAGAIGASLIAIVLSVAGLLLLDLVLIEGLIGGFWRMLSRFRDD